MNKEILLRTNLRLTDFLEIEDRHLQYQSSLLSVQELQLEPAKTSYSISHRTASGYVFHQNKDKFITRQGLHLMWYTNTCTLHANNIHMYQVNLQSDNLTTINLSADNLPLLVILNTRLLIVFDCSSNVPPTIKIHVQKLIMNIVYACFPSENNGEICWERGKTGEVALQIFQKQQAARSWLLVFLNSSSLKTITMLCYTSGLLMVVLVRGSHTSIPTSYLESIGLFTPGVFIKFCQAIAEKLQHTDAQQSRNGKPKFKESLSPDDIAKSHLQHGTIAVI